MSGAVPPAMSVAKRCCRLSQLTSSICTSTSGCAASKRLAACWNVPRVASLKCATMTWSVVFAAAGPAARPSARADAPSHESTRVGLIGLPPCLLVGGSLVDALGCEHRIELGIACGVDRGAARLREVVGEQLERDDAEDGAQRRIAAGR